MTNFTQKEICIISDMLNGVEHKIITQDYSINLEYAHGLVTKYREKNKPPPKKYQLDTYGYILKDGRQVNDCGELHKVGTAHNQPWLKIESDCFAFHIEQNKYDVQSTIFTMCYELKSYFNRTQDALVQQYFKIQNK